MPLVQVIIDESSPRIIAGEYQWDRTNGGVIILPGGTSFPSTPTPGEYFVRTDELKIYRRNDGDTAWEAITAAVAAHATTHEPGGSDALTVDAAAGVGSLRTLGTGAQQACAGNDARLSDARTPTAHAATHKGDGADAIAVATTSVAGLESAADKTKLDGIAAGATNTPLSSTAPVNVTKAAAAAGVATEAARQDHKHDVSTAAPVAIGTANAEGAATSLARSDHVHNHGNQSVATHHAVATTGANGFMSSADKTKLDDLYTEQYDGESDGNSTTTATTPQTKLNVTETLNGGDYKITWYAEVQSGTNLTCVRVRVTLDPGDPGEEDLAFNDLFVYNPTGVSTEGVASGFAIRTLTSGSHTFRISYETTDGTYTVLIRRARLHIERIG